MVAGSVQQISQNREMAKLSTGKKDGLKPGVVYFGSLPPFMKPQKLRHLLQQHGDVTKLYLAPEDSAKRKRRIKQGGNSKLRYSEGWAEFASKKVAKSVARRLNSTPIGGRSKRNFHYYDLWCIKYLSGFRWEQLTESLIYESKTKEARLRAEISKTKKANEFFLQQVTTAKKIDGIVARKKKSSVKLKQPNVRQKVYQSEIAQPSSNEELVLKDIL